MGKKSVKNDVASFMIGLSNLTVSKTLTEIENIPCQNVLANEEKYQEANWNLTWRKF